jgi:GDPmannose 4,6-dehydratase
LTRALIIGSAGQDGSYLSEQLAARGVEVVGLTRTGVAAPPGLVQPARVDLARADQVDALLASVAPTHLYYLAAHHHASSDAHAADLSLEFERSFEVHVQGWVHVLEALGRHAPGCRAFYAASSHVFGTPAEPVQSERTPFSPLSPYAISKAAGIDVARFYRGKGRHASVGILYNHESPRRRPQFVTQRIAAGAVRAAAGDPTPLELGDLSAVVDWGWAPDFTDAMWRITEQPQADDYVVATGEPHTVQDFCAEAYWAVGLEWRKFVVEKPSALSRRVAPLVGDASKLRTRTGWAPKVPFAELVRRLVEAARASGAKR